MKTSIIVPVKKFSSRLTSKNTREFCGHRLGMFEVKMKQLMRTSSFDEVVVTTDDDSVISYVKNMPDMRFRAVQEPNEFANNPERTPEDFIKYAADICTGDHIFWVHVTSPLTCSQDYDLIKTSYQFALQWGHDSLLTAVEIKNFILNKKAEVLNKQIAGFNIRTKWPATQHLESLYEPTHSVFAASRKLHHQGIRVGTNPYFYLVDRYSTIDVDYEGQFKQAETLMQSMYRGLAL